MQIEKRLLSSLKPYSKNARQHTSRQIDQIATSIKEFGFTQPVVVNRDGMILAGHGRVAAAKKIGMKEVPCVIADQWDEAQQKAYVLIDNRLSELSAWDFRSLEVEVGEVEELGFSLSDFDFEELFDDRDDPDQNAADENDCDDQEEKTEKTVFPLVLSLNRKQYEEWKRLKKQNEVDDSGLIDILMGLK